MKAGGILYMFEEATVTAWPTELTFRAFVCSVCGALVSRALFNLAGQDVHRVLIYTQDRWEVGTWSWMDVPFFVLLAGSMGLLSALFSRVLVAVWACRARWNSRLIAWQPFAKVLECILYASLCAALFALAPLVTGCTAEGHFVSDSAVADMVAYGKKNASAETSKEDDHRLKLVPHNCPSDEVSEAATLLLSSTEGAVKHLYSRARVAPPVLLLVLVLYTTLAAGMPGLPVPMGNFLPSMLIGALAGRLVGEGIELFEVNIGLVADAGVYSLAAHVAPGLGLAAEGSNLGAGSGGKYTQDEELVLGMSLGMAAGNQRAVHRLHPAKAQACMAAGLGP
ncbi:unnamed protein product [Prorocentrum cordatum]|uniref:H(+)-exporting diphosphatase n=1 Tax=Prorocentrum cordatum TaxID=2364126 RepID=A0ABN9TAC7_9DINO|nr:unnamed protein product [Polarella glacialis]